jgi:hypothetical protein
MPTPLAIPYLIVVKTDSRIGRRAVRLQYSSGAGCRNFAQADPDSLDATMIQGSGKCYAEAVGSASPA